MSPRFSASNWQTEVDFDVGAHAGVTHPQLAHPVIIFLQSRKRNANFALRKSGFPT